MSKTWATILSILLTLAIMAPIHKGLRGARGDSFPLSWYPMFSRPRPALEPVDYVIGITADGERHIVHSKHHVRGTMNRARRQLTRLAKRSATARTLCEQVSEKFGRRRRGKISELVQVRIVRGRFDLKQYFGAGHKAPVSEKIHWACQVPGRREFRVPERGEIFHFQEPE